MILLSASTLDLEATLSEVTHIMDKLSEVYPLNNSEIKLFTTLKLWQKIIVKISGTVL
jgi:hypothetical protein